MRWIVANASRNLLHLALQLRAARHLAHHHAHEIRVVAPRAEQDLRHAAELLVRRLRRGLHLVEAFEQLAPVSRKIVASTSCFEGK